MARWVIRQYPVCSTELKNGFCSVLFCLIFGFFCCIYFRSWWFVSLCVCMYWSSIMCLYMTYPNFWKSWSLNSVHFSSAKICVRFSEDMTDLGSLYPSFHFWITQGISSSTSLRLLLKALILVFWVFGFWVSFGFLGKLHNFPQAQQ